jgi:exodeoxyribonuclease VII small subunit
MVRLFSGGLPVMAKAHQSKAPQSFEAALAELESVVAALEGGQLSLEESLAAYRRGSELLRYTQGVLDDAQQQIRILEDERLRELPSDDDSD